MRYHEKSEVYSSLRLYVIPAAWQARTGAQLASVGSLAEGPSMNAAKRPGCHGMQIAIQLCIE